LKKEVSLEFPGAIFWMVVNVQGFLKESAIWVILFVGISGWLRVRR